MKLITSSSIKLPIVYLISSQSELRELPLGVPFIFGKKEEYGKYVKLMEWEILWQEVIRSKFKLKWRDILIKNGYEDTYFGSIAYSSGKLIESKNFYEDLSAEKKTVSSFLNDIRYKVDMDLLNDLKLLPTWFGELEKLLVINITDTINFNPTAYNKKMNLQIGDATLASPERNLIIIDISSSIPKGVSYTILSFARTFAERFYTDLLITGSKSTLYNYENLEELNVDEIYKENGTDNDQTYFKELVSFPKKYKTVICFGDHHNPGQGWNNKFNTKTKVISTDSGKELCKWEVKEIISFHTTSEKELAGYATWFNVRQENIKFMKDWVKDMSLVDY